MTGERVGNLSGGILLQVINVGRFLPRRAKIAGAHGDHFQFAHGMATTAAEIERDPPEFAGHDAIPFRKAQAGIGLHILTVLRDQRDAVHLTNRADRRGSERRKRQRQRAEERGYGMMGSDAFH